MLGSDVFDSDRGRSVWATVGAHITVRPNSLLDATMPSDQSTWLIAVPQDGDAEGLQQELETKFQQQLRTFDRSSLAQLSLPTFKVRRPCRLHYARELTAHS